MADALVSIVLERLALVIQQQIQQELRLVVGAENDTQKLTNTLKNIRAVLVDAEKRQVKDEAVKIWLKDLKGLAYDMDNVLDEWSSSILKVQIQGVDNTLTHKKKINTDLWVKKSPATTKPTAMAGYCLITTIPEAVLGTNHWRIRLSLP
ncbi:putative disease resistance protein RGA4 isoform X1 [Vitis riparia]|uniref:putative disease resistance protein RGA4 isoform X1 n=1 Tax=Vitis riparia TaxID=96939 RepID=UPI00155AFAC4|nr:putative disease resistance protein RGA4 isoform X1 [Vitis riparia]